ncbi:MAG TPA: DUF4157 domain-containing protein [Thermoanaerobaculia bacterium]|nr:DUF4157 domain-containing protein [Thermoanaerobaculia bacterium]
MRTRAYETQADHAADDFVRSGPAAGARTAKPLPSREIPSKIPAPARDAISSSPGKPLDASTRAAMEPHFGHDFGRVRVHDDGKAAESARKLDALAYTVGPNIVLGPQSPALDTRGGQHLLAHELSHVVQQASGAPVHIQRKPPSHRTDFRFDSGSIDAESLSDEYVIDRLHSMSRAELRAYRMRVADPGVQQYIDRLLSPDAVEQVETDWVEISKQNVDTVAGLSYWEQRTLKVYSVTTSTDRISKNAEERDAVFAAVWRLRPTPNPSTSFTEVVDIPPNRERRNGLLYRFEFRQPTGAGAKPRLSIHFLLENPAGTVDYAVPAPKVYVPPVLSLSNDVEAYFETHREEKNQIAWWLKKQTGEFEQAVVTKSQPRGTAQPVETTFIVKGKKKPKGGFESLTIELLDQPKPTTVTPPAGYRGKDFADLRIEEAQSTPHATKGDTLGHVDLTGVPQDEALSVKYFVASYWTTRQTRNAEVDAIVPIANTNRKVFYTLRFRPDNEVDVERVGEQGSSPKLDPSALDVARVRGYEDNDDDPPKLKKWLGKRYPAVKPAGATVEELRQSANTEMAAKASTADWFNANYKMPVLGADATFTRLKNVHKLKPPQIPDTDKKDFVPAELKLTELSLQTLTDAIVTKLQQVRLGRKTVPRKADGAVEPYAAQAFGTGASRTVVMYDTAFNSAGESVFRGGVEGVNAPETMTITHEFGHSVEFQMSGLKDAFNRFVKRENIKPFTKYAGEKPDQEFFAEAFAISQTDPGWLKNHSPRVYFWFESFNRTGKVPK